MQIPDLKEGETVVFSSPPAKDIKQLLSFLKVKVIVRKLCLEVGKNEILACGGGTQEIHAILPQLTSGAAVEHIIPTSDCSQQLWICGDYALRLVSWAEDLFQELARGKQRLCLIDGAHHVALRSGAEDYVQLARRPRLSGRQPVDCPKTHCAPGELVSELVRISPATQYVITCHMKGQGVSREDRAQYERFSEVIKVMGRVDSLASQKYLLGLVRRLYA
jgi:hypothetical protein